MKNLSLFLSLTCLAIAGFCQTSPASFISPSESSTLKASQTQGDTIDFAPFPTGTTITTQYLNQGVLFSGFDGSGPPMIHDYISAPSYGRTLVSENWFFGIKISFVDSLDTTVYHPARRIEFDNVVEYNGEIDYIHIDVYDTNGVVIHSYNSQSPEHVVLDFPNPVVAYITIDDSAGTAYATDNYLIDFDPLVSTALNALPAETSIFPNPSTGLVNVVSHLPMDEVVVFNSIGQRVRQLFPENGQAQFEIEKPGIYFARVKSMGNTQTFKFLVAP